MDPYAIIRHILKLVIAASVLSTMGCDLSEDLNSTTLGITRPLGSDSGHFEAGLVEELQAVLERQGERSEDPFLEREVEFEEAASFPSVSPICDIEIQPLATATAGGDITVLWDETMLYTGEVYISVFSGWNPASYAYTGFHLNNGEAELTLPGNLPASGSGNPPIEYHVYVESAENGVRTTECWDYEPLEVTSEVSLGEIWGTASAHMGNVQGFNNANQSLAALGDRPGGLVWRLDLDTMQTEIVVEFDPATSDIWYLGGLALHPTQPLAYITAFTYDASGGYVQNDWLDGYDTLIELNTDTHQVTNTWHLAPDPFTFTGYAQDFVDGDGDQGLYSPGGLQFIDGELYAIEGMTVENPDLVHFDLSQSPPLLTQDNPAFAEDHWGGGVVTDGTGQLFAACAQLPQAQVDPNGNPAPYIPEPFQWIEYDFGGNNDCDDALFTFELDRVHGVTLDGDDTLFAVRSTRTYWYEQAFGQGAPDLNVYTVDTDGSMQAVVDLTSVMSAADAPIDGLGNIDWRAQ